MKKLFYFALLIVSLDAFSQDSKKLLIENLDSIVNKFMREYDLPGVSVGIVTNHEIIYMNHFGVANAETLSALNDSSIFQIESITKVFTAFAIMKLYEEGELNLDVSINKYLPYFNMSDTNSYKITIRHLLNHTSGLPSLYKGFRGDPCFQDDAIKKYIINMASRPLEFEPGKNRSYSNTGFVVLSAIIEEVTNTKYEDYIEETILHPLAMNNSFFDIPVSQIDNKVALHVIGKDYKNAVFNKDISTRWIVGAGGLKSTIPDMCKFLQMNLNRGTAKGNQIVSQDNFDTILNNQFAWNVYKVWGGKNLIDHGGSSLGCSAEIAFMPNDSLGIVVLCNNRNGAEWILAEALLKTALGIQVKESRLYLADIIYKKLREEGAENAIAYLKEKLEKSKDEVSPYSIALLAYRIVQGGNPENLDTAKQIFELLMDSYPEISILHDMLGETYFKLSSYRYRKAFEIDSLLWGTKETLEQLEKINLDLC